MFKSKDNIMDNGLGRLVCINIQKYSLLEFTNLLVYYNR